MNRDELKGKAEAVKGKIEKKFGDLTNDEDLRDPARRVPFFTF